MRRARDRLFLAPNWHVDCRLVAELPEDSVVGVRFIIYAVSIAIALGAVLFTGWYGYADFSLRQQIEDGNRQMEDTYWDVAEVRRMQRFYEIEAKKIENAYAEINNPIFLSGFISEIGRTIPEPMLVDSFDYGNGKMVVRGRLHESPERASQTIGSYVQKLRVEPSVGTSFASINITNLERSTEDDQVMNFEITFHVNPRPL
jgi:hypothetical protein